MLEGSCHWLRRFVAGLSTPRPGYDSSSVCVGFMVDRVPLGQVYVRVLEVPRVTVIPPMFLISLSTADV